MAKITLMKPYRQTETLRLVEMTELVDMIRGEEYRALMKEIRKSYPIYHWQREADGTMTGQNSSLICCLVSASLRNW